VLWPDRISARNQAVLASSPDGRVIDRCQPLEQVIDATRYIETEQKTGNVVLIIGDSHTRYERPPRPRLTPIPGSNRERSTTVTQV
jgi:hypothetical protein